MALDKTKTYMVYNYDTSPISVSTRMGSVLIPAGADGMPSGLPFSYDDISYINMTTTVFKTGMLWFEPEYENALYSELRIVDYDDIMTNQEIEDIIVNPTLEKIEKLLSIEDPGYFNRCYGVYIGLRNDGVSMSGKITDIMNARMNEFKHNKRKTGIKVRPVEQESSSVDQKEVDDLKKQLADMQAMMAQLMNRDSDANTEPVDTVKKTTAKKTTTKKKTEEVKTSVE